MFAQKYTEVVLFVILAAIYSGDATKLPSYITPCSRDQATLTECATNEARKVLPIIINGDKSLKIPSLNPLKIPEVTIDTGSNLVMKHSDVIVSGFEDFDLHSLDIQLEKRYVILKIAFPRVNFLSQCEINGRISLLPIKGNGPANITFVGGDYTYRGDIISEERSNKEYLKLVNPKLDVTTKRSYFRLDNLFDGDQILGDQMNKFLDENWREVSKEFGPALKDVISTIATSIMNSVLSIVSTDELFKD